MNERPLLARVRVKEKIPPAWRFPAWVDWIGDIKLSDETEGGTTLSVRLKDQPALFGLMNQLNSLGLTVTGIEVNDDE